MCGYSQTDCDGSDYTVFGYAGSAPSERGWWSIEPIEGTDQYTLKDVTHGAYLGERA